MYIYELKCSENKEEQVKKVCKIFEENVRRITIFDYKMILNWINQFRLEMILLAIEEVSKRNIKSTMYIDTYLKIKNDIDGKGVERVRG